MTSPAERLLLLSLRILRAAANPRLEAERKGLILQKLTARKTQILSEIPTAAATSAGDRTRLALARYYNAQASLQIRAQI